MESKINILIVCKPTAGSNNRGIQTEMWDLGKSFSRIGYEVTILYTENKSNCENSFMKEGIVITQIPYNLNPIARLAKKYFFNLTTQRWIEKNKTEFDIIHIQGQSDYVYTRNKYPEPFSNAMDRLTLLKKTFSHTSH